MSKEVLTSNIRNLVRRHWRFANLAVFALLLSFMIGYSLHSQQLRDLKTVKPFSIEQKTVESRNDGTVIGTRKVTLARKKDGSYVRSYSIESPDGEVGTRIEILDVARMAHHQLEPFTKLMTTFYYSPQEIADLESQVEFWGRCEDYIQAYPGRTEDKMLGYSVWSVSDSTRNGKVSLWVAPSLDCYPLRKTVTTPDVRIDQIVTNVVEGDPPRVAIPNSSWLRRSLTGATGSGVECQIPRPFLPWRGAHTPISRVVPQTT